MICLVLKPVIPITNKLSLDVDTVQVIKFEFVFPKFLAIF